MNKIKVNIPKLKTVLSKNKIPYFYLALIFVLGIVTAPRIFAQLHPVKSVEIFSEKLDYEKKEPGAWKIKKSAKWKEKGTAEITFDVDSIMKSNTKYTDILFVLDVSGSMDGEKLDKVKADSIQLIESLLANDKNKAGLITFETNSQIVSPLTNNKEELINKINSLTTTGCTNYYQALVNVDTVLKDYVKEKDKECIVLFLTDGYPNEEIPNEEGQYSYLKSQYPFITINGVQYEMGSTILNPIKKVSDNQYIADMETLNNVLFEASITPVTYENFEITDYIDTNYFYVESENDIKVSQGNISFDKDNQKFTWKMDDLKSGLKAKVTIKAKLKEELLGKGGIYSTNEKEDVKSTLNEDEENVTSSKTPILSNNYKVVYDGNKPSGCKVESVPSEKQHTVFDTVEISNSVPKCEGYQFKGWKIINKNAKKVNDDYFIMPEEDVTLKANWSKLGISKSMEGTIKEKITLYKQIKQDYENNKGAQKYTGDTSTFKENQDIYYYKGKTQNNNVIFGGFCWSMYRTTDTGGVKMIYNGEPDSEGKCGTNRETHVGYDSRTTQTLSANYNYGTDYTYDEVSKTFTLSGDLEQVIWNSTTYQNLIGRYTCANTTGTCSTLYYVESYKSNTSAEVIPISLNTKYSEIGKSKFNNNDTSIADVGYMYNARYISKTKQMYNTELTLNDESISNSYYYADDIEWNPSTMEYTLVNPFKITSSSDYLNIAGKYTFSSSDEVFSKNYVKYIEGINERSRTMYTVAFRDGENIHSTEESYYFADSLVDDGNGKQVLDPKTTKKVKKIEWFNEHKNYENKYYCSNLTCDKVYYVTLTAPNLFVRLDISNNYKYGSSFIYDNSTGEYTLNGKVQNFLEWGAENSDAKLENTHYTCWNSEGKCKTLSYIYNIQGVNMNNVPISNISPYYFELNSGKDIETIINEMLYANDVNKYNSAIKSVIDLWYSKYMRQYTKYLEDTVWCNERSISNMNENGLNKDGGGYKSEIKFSAYTDNKENLTCLNEIDRFTVDKMNGNGALTYPVGLITEQERKMAFQYSTKESPIMSKSVSWLNSPYYYRYGNAYGNYLAQDGDDSYYGRDYIGGLMGVRPSISLKNGVTYNSGDGSIEAPYVIEIDH